MYKYSIIIPATNLPKFDYEEFSDAYKASSKLCEDKVYHIIVNNEMGTYVNMAEAYRKVN